LTLADSLLCFAQLQCIALMWTLLKQSPIPGKPAIDKAIVVCPSSLVRNWANELVKWLGEGATNPLAIDGKQTGPEIAEAINQWCSAKGKAVVTPIVIVSYERLRMLSDRLGNTEVGLLLADEGHRLKNADNLTYNGLNTINCKRRIILTGTPIQNDLNEYFSLLNFCNPGYLGTKENFRKQFELPILHGRDGDATDKQKEKGDAALKDLLLKVNKFIIRRTNDLLSKYRTSSLTPDPPPDSRSCFAYASVIVSSPRQVRARRVLFALAVPARPVQILQQLARDQGAR